MARQLRHDQPPPGQQKGRQREPVRRRAPQPVHEQQWLALAGDEVAQPAATRIGEALLESRQFGFCVRHRRRLLFDVMDRSGRQDP